MDNMPHSVPGKGKANENKTNKSIQVEGREAAERVLFWSNVLLLSLWKQQHEDHSLLLTFSKFWQHYNLVAQAIEND